MSRFAVTGVLCMLLAGCSNMGGSVYVGTGYGDYYDPWYWGPGYYRPPEITHPRPPVKPTHPIGRPPARPVTLPATRPAGGRRR